MSAVHTSTLAELFANVPQLNKKFFITAQHKHLQVTLRLKVTCEDITPSVLSTTNEILLQQNDMISNDQIRSGIKETVVH